MRQQNVTTTKLENYCMIQHLIPICHDIDFVYTLYCITADKYDMDQLINYMTDQI